MTWESGAASGVPGNGITWRAGAALAGDADSASATASASNPRTEPPIALTPMLVASLAALSQRPATSAPSGLLARVGRFRSVRRPPRTRFQEPFPERRVPAL